MADYPVRLERRRHLFDGTPVTIRPIRPDDADMEQAFVRHLSDDSRYFRFMQMLRELPPRKLEYMTRVDYERHMALVATVEREGKEVEVGVARYVVGPEDGCCEFAVTVDDEWQGSGVAGMLMASLIEAATQAGLATMEGYVLASNHKMLKFARQLGFSIRRDLGDGDTVHVVRPLGGAG